MNKFEKSQGIFFKLNNDKKSYCVEKTEKFLKKLTVPRKYKEKPVTAISDNALFCCTLLESLKIPNSVKSIGYCAFCYCKSLKEVHYDGTMEEWEKIKFLNEFSNPLCYGAKLILTKRRG